VGIGFANIGKVRRGQQVEDQPVITLAENVVGDGTRLLGDQERTEVVIVRDTFGGRYTYAMDNEAILDEIQDNTKEGGLRLRASLSLLHSQGMIDDADYRELALCLRTSLAMVEAAYMEARRRGWLADVILTQGRGYEEALSVVKPV
jgi:hypothetical protein